MVVSVFDAGVFAKKILEGVRRQSVEHEGLLEGEFGELEKDIEATLAALEFESDMRRARALKEDLDRFLPQRQAAILAIARKNYSVYMVAALETEITTLVKGTSAVAAAFARSA